MAAVVLYLAVVVPGVKQLMDPLSKDTEEERVEVLRIIGAGNTMAIACLVAVLAMQVSCSEVQGPLDGPADASLSSLKAGQEYARRYMERELAKLKEKEGKALPVEKKTQ